MIDITEKGRIMAHNIYIDLCDIHKKNPFAEIKCNCRFSK